MITGSVQENVKNLEIDVPKKTPATPRYLAKIIDIPIFNTASYTGTYLDLSNKAAVVRYEQHGKCIPLA